MPVTDLNHYFVRANDLEATRAFYCEALELEPMPRPTFAFPGYWLGRDGKIWVHMGPADIANADRHYLGTPARAPNDNSGVVDHIAFSATDPEAFRERLTRMDCDWWARVFPEFDLFQIFVRDPNGLTIELNFYNMAEMPDWAEDYKSLPEATQ